MIITIACPEAHKDIANHLAACLTGIAADLGTYVNASYTDGTDNYCVTAPAVTQTFFTRAATADFDVPEGADAALAMDALQRVVIVNNAEDFAPVPATADVILVYVGFDTVDALSFMGLSRKNDE
jgi:hypothetical protein